MIFANTDHEITLIYNSDEHIGKQILAFIQAENLPAHTIDLVHETLSPTHWADLSVRMNMPIRDFVNTERAAFIQKFPNIKDLSDNDWLTVLVNNPDVLKAPIVMKGDKIVMMSNAQDMLRFV
jgi:arsenate reductase